MNSDQQNDGGIEHGLFAKEPFDQMKKDGPDNERDDMPEHVPIPCSGL
jgi:hypothetical protein